MALNWDDSLLVRNAEIDEQHRQIFDHFENLSIACQENKGELVLRNILRVLDNYVEVHFLHEEAFMSENGYPKLPEHQVQHAHFRQTVKDLREMDIQNADPHRLSLIVYQKLIQWFILHIKQLDQEMVNYYLD